MQEFIVTRLQTLPISVTARSKALGCGRLLAGIEGANPSRDMDVCLVNVVCYQLEVSATGWSLVQRSPIECGVSECDRDASIMRRPWLLCQKKKAKNCNCYETWFDSREVREIYVLSKTSRPAVELVGPLFSGYQELVRRGKGGPCPSREEVKN